MADDAASPSRTQRAGALAGIAFVVVSTVTLLTSPHARSAAGKPSSLFAPGDQWAQYILEHHGATENYVWVGVALGTVLGLWWLGTTRSVLDRSGEDQDGVATVAFTGGLFMFVMFWVGAAVQFSVTYRPDTTLTGAVVRPFLVAFAVATTFGVVGLVAFASATAVLVRRGDSLPGWLAPVGWAMSIAGVVTLTAPLFSSGAFAIGGAANIALTQGEISLWIVTVSIATLSVRR